jgi:branched-subunit amino acid aminotransferase/4-amino-4-deoxychorismate lyase
MSWVNVNGALVSASAGHFTTHHRALRYGDGFFESMRVVKDHLCFSAQHLQRIRESLDVLELDPPFLLKEETLVSEVLKTLQANQLHSARVRCQIWRKGGGLYAPDDRAAEFAIFSDPLHEEEYSLNTEGLKLALYQDQVKVYGKLSALKSSSALLYVMAAAHARNLGCDEAIVFNHQSRIAESSSSNIWLISQRQWFTPPLTEACIDGVMRRVILRLLHESDIPFKEQAITLDDLNSADAVLLSNATRGLRWVNRIEETSYDKPDIAEIIHALNLKSAAKT